VTAQPNANDSFPDGAWGRVDADGTVFVRTTDGERAVGQYPEGSPDEALAFFTRRYEALAFEVTSSNSASTARRSRPTRRASR
jgi:hypothetical protein